MAILVGPRSFFGGLKGVGGRKEATISAPTPLAPPAPHGGGSWEDMEYAGGLTLCGLPHGLVVKNTFLDYPAAREADEEFRVDDRGREWKSCPPSALMHDPSWTTPRPSSLLIETESFLSGADSLSFSSDEGAGEDNDGGGGGRFSEFALEQLPRPTPVFSEGSIPHQLGQECRPCGFVHKPEGCANGAGCQYCHLCPAGEIKQRKKTKRTGMRKVHFATHHRQQQHQKCFL